MPRKSDVGTCSRSIVLPLRPDRIPPSRRRSCSIGLSNHLYNWYVLMADHLITISSNKAGAWFPSIIPRCSRSNARVHRLAHYNQPPSPWKPPLSGYGITSRHSCVEYSIHLGSPSSDRSPELLAPDDSIAPITDDIFSGFPMNYE